MPELPEVETTIRGLKKTIVGLVIKDVWTDLNTKDKRQHDAIANPKYFKFFKKETAGKKIQSIERRGKNILINLSSGKTILIHMKMTGHLLYGKYNKIKEKWTPQKSGPLNDSFNRFIHVVFILSNDKHLAFSDARKFGKITLLNTKGTHNSRHLKNIGPEPLHKDFTTKKFEERLKRKLKGKVKTVLMDQTIIAGIGNIYSDEILWRVGMHPERRILKIKRSEFKKIFKIMRKILTKGIDLGGDSMSDYRNLFGKKGKFQLEHKAYRRTGEKCGKRNCSGVIERKVINGRSGHFCTVHQKL